PYVPQATPATVAAGFGTRASIVSYLEGLGWTGERRDLNDGRERWRGEYGSYLVEVIGPAHAVDTLSLMISVDEGSAELSALLVYSLLSVYVPGDAAQDFAVERIKALAAGGDARTRSFGDVSVTVN